MTFSRRPSVVLVVVLVAALTRQALSQNSTTDRVAQTVSSVGSSLANATSSVANSTSGALSSASNATRNAANASTTALSSTAGAASSVLNVTDANAVLEGAELEDAVAENADAQEYREDPVVPVRAQVVGQEPAVELANGDADLSTTGICEDDIDEFCQDVMPGLGRLSICLSDQLKEQEKDNYNGAQVTSACVTELDKFKRDQSDNINQDLPLDFVEVITSWFTAAQACNEDVEKLCSTLVEGESALSCLREHKDQVSGQCSSQIFRRQEDAAGDFRLDKELYAACQADAQLVCNGIDPHEGKVQECLKGQRSALSYDCQAELFRQEQEDSEDLRLSVRLFHKCFNDKVQFCGDVPPGNARAKECLELHRNDTNFTSECRAELEDMTEARAADFRLDPQLKKHCTKDIESLCYLENEEVRDLPDDHAQVITCLQDFRDEIQDQACKARVTKVKEVAASDIRFDIPLAEACYTDRQEFCANVQPGSARVIRCLQNRRDQLSQMCSAQLFDEEVDMAESIDFQIPMKVACIREIGSFCKDIPHGHARVIRCLQDHLQEGNFTSGCKDEVQRYEQTASTDYRLNYRLTRACEADLNTMCTDVCVEAENEDKACGGTVLRCLADKIDDVTDDNCKQELLYFQKMEVRDFRNDVILAEACRPNVDQFCAAITPGEGKVHQCLLEHQEELTGQCLTETHNLQAAEASNIALTPSLGQACQAERASYCPNVTPGKARVFNCLLAHADKMNVSAECHNHLMSTQENRLRDFRLDYGLRTQCKSDITQQCSQARSDQDDGTGAVLKCLVAANDTLSTSCLREVQRAVASGLMLYQPNLPVTASCDEDVTQLCLKNQGWGTFRVGQVKECLVNLGVPLDPAIMLAAEAEAAEAAPTASNQVVAAANATRDLAANATSAATGRRLLESWATLAAGHHLHRHLLQSSTALSAECKNLVVLAEPTDAFAQYQTSLSASVVSSQMASLESKLGLRSGTLASTNSGGVTLTGWSAIFGVMAIVTVAVAGAVFGYRRYQGLDKHAGYTMVHKSRAAKQVEMNGH